MAERIHPPVPPRGAVLVLDADQPAALAVLRSLARRGLRVEVASTDSRAIGRRSRHASAFWCHPDPLADADAFVQWLEAHLRSHAYGLVIPLTERSVVPLAQQRDRFATGLIAVADADALAQVIDKQRTVALAATLGIPVPLAEPVHDAAQAPQAAQRLGYPVVVKPARSVGSQGGQRVQLSVSYAFDERELLTQVESALRYGPVLLQEYFAGDGVGIELIADRGELQYSRSRAVEAACASARNRTPIWWTPRAS
jgi:carbamoylphosphate synthase large subunit